MVDLTTPALSEAVETEASLVVEYEKALRVELLRDTGLDRPAWIQGEEAWRELARLHGALEYRTREIAQELSSAEWLWYLRRVPWLFEGRNSLASTAPYIKAVAEAASVFSTKPAPPSGSEGQLLYDMGPQAARSVLRLFVAACFHYDLQSALRWVGKGAPVQCSKDRSPHAARRPEPSLAQSVRLWDKRMQRGVDLLSRAGLTRAGEDELTRESAGSMVVLWGPRDLDHWGVDFVDLSRVPLLSDASVPEVLRWPSDLLDLIVLLGATASSDTLHDMMRAGLSPMARTGYRVVKRAAVLSEFDKALAILDHVRLNGTLPLTVALSEAETVLARLLSAESRLWPPTWGPPIRVAADDFVIVDLHAASQRFHRTLQRPQVTGAVVNAWSGHLERSVQRAIDETAWRPSPAVATLRGRHLRNDGKTITDLDAVGERDGTLLLISCKSTPFSGEFDRGEYKAVRNLKTAALKAVDDWATKVGDLRRHPMGGNYDLTGYRRIIGVVVYPFLPWTPLGPATAEVARGLRALSTVVELHAWCSRTARP
jgi:hypothetical protein